MKRVLAIVMSVALLISVLAYAETALNFQPAEETTEQKLERMIPVLDSFARALGVEGEIAYSAEEQEFVWTQLYLMAANWGAKDARVTVQPDCLTVPAEVMNEYAQASFFNLQELAPLPAADSVSDSPITFEELTNTYRVPQSDMGQNYIVVERYAVDPLNSLDNLLVGFGLYDGETNVRLGGFYATMILRPAPLDAQAEPSADSPVQFPYSVSSVAMESEEDFAGLSITRCNLRYVDPELEPAATAVPTPTAAPYGKLSKGDRGDAVKAMQRRLNELGYNCGSADGVFGSSTKRAVRYFQDALGVNQDGVATSSLQERLFAANAPEYQAYVTLKKGSDGVRVEKLQSRLRDLGYLAEAVDGDFGSRTAEAVKAFQAQAGLKQDGVAGTSTLKALDKKNAPKCENYIELRRGDSGIRVTEMQDQLRKLGFLAEKKSSGSYDKKTVEAVKAFAQAVGVNSDGKKADAALIGKMFTYVAPTTEPTTAPTTEPTTAPTDEPTTAPTDEPTTAPTDEPTDEPTTAPTDEPTTAPTDEPTTAPTDEPTTAPTDEPTTAPTDEPTTAPTDEPTTAPTDEPTTAPTDEPTSAPTETPKPQQVISDQELNEFVLLLNQKLMPETEYTAVAAVEWLQEKLAVTKNGIYDAATQEAVNQYQQTNEHLTVSGLVDEDTLDSLLAA